MPTMLPVSSRPAPTRLASRSTSPSGRSLRPSADAFHNRMTARGSTDLGPASPFSFAAKRSTSPSWRYASEESLLAIRNGTTATRLLSGRMAGVDHRFRARAAATTATASPAAMATRRLGMPRTAAEGLTSLGPAPYSAATNSSVVANRSAGTLASATSIARSTAGDTVSRTVRSGGTGELSRLAMIAWAVGPVNGGSPASIS